MRIMVTGGAGFIGSAVIRHIISDTEHDVVNVDKLTYAGNLDSLVSVSSSGRYSLEQVDICDSGAVTDVLAKHQPHVVMHLAAESHVDRSIDGPAEFIRTNIIGTYVLLEAARAYCSRLVEADSHDHFFRFLRVFDQLPADYGLPFHWVRTRDHHHLYPLQHGFPVKCT